MRNSFTGVANIVIVEENQVLLIDIDEDIILDDQPVTTVPLVITGQRRLEPGVFGNALLVESGATNLVPNPSFEVEF